MIILIFQTLLIMLNTMTPLSKNIPRQSEYITVNVYVPISLHNSYDKTLLILNTILYWLKFNFNNRNCVSSPKYKHKNKQYQKFPPTFTKISRKHTGNNQYQQDSEFACVRARAC